MTTWEELQRLAVAPRPWTRDEAANQRAAERVNTQCTGKARHSTERAARAEAAAADSYLHTYRCPHCRQWHVGKR